MPAPTVQVEIIGLNALRERFRQMLGPDLLKIELEAAKWLGPQLEAIYREAAPKSQEGQLHAAQMSDPAAMRMRRSARASASRAHRAATGHSFPKQKQGKRFEESIQWGTNLLMGGGGSGFRLWVETSQSDKRRWLYEGTGVYGPSGQRITPKNGKALAFMWNGSPWVLHSVAGMKSQKEWETRARVRAIPVIGMMAQRMGLSITAQLSDRGHV